MYITTETLKKEIQNAYPETLYELSSETPNVVAENVLAPLDAVPNMAMPFVLRASGREYTAGEHFSVDGAQITWDETAAEHTLSIGDVVTVEYYYENETELNARLEAAILLARDFIDRVTGQFFEERTKSFYLSGLGTPLLHLPLYASTLTSVMVNGVERDADGYIHFNEIQDRDNPKILFDVAIPKGLANVKVTGTFGYVEEDGSTPLPIQNACLKLAIVEFLAVTSNERRELLDRGRITRETTDGHSYTLSDALSKGGGTTGDVEVDEILARYMRPMN